MKRHTREGQIKTCYRIRDQIKTYLRWKECRTKASFFTRSELDNHIFNLNLIQTITDEGKIAVKANQLQRLLVRILKKEYDEEPQIAHIPHLKRGTPRTKKNGSRPISEDKKISARQRDTRRSRNSSPTKT